MDKKIRLLVCTILDNSLLQTIDYVNCVIDVKDRSEVFIFNLSEAVKPIIKNSSTGVVFDFYETIHSHLDSLYIWVELLR